MRLIALVRTPDAITATVMEGGPDFKVRRLPLSQLSLSIYPAARFLEESWRFLSHIRAADDATHERLRFVLYETIPDTTVDWRPSGSPLPVDWAETAVTARGPRFRKLKVRQPAPVDLRPYLCDPLSLSRILAAFEQTGIEDWFDKVLWAMPPRFAQFVYPALRHLPQAEVSHVLSLHRRWNLDHNPQLLRAFSYLLRDSVPQATAWTHAALELTLSESRRLTLLTILAATGALRLTPSAPLLEAIHVTCSASSEDSRFARWLRFLLEKAVAGEPLEYLLTGFRLAATQFYRHSFQNTGSCPGFESRYLDAIHESEGAHTAFLLWQHCERCPGLMSALRQEFWLELEQGERFLYFAALRARRRLDPSHLDACHSAILDVPSEYRLKALRLFIDTSEYENHPGVPALIRSLCRPPFESSGQPSRSLCHLLPAAGLLSGAPESSILAWEHTCSRRTNDQWLIEGAVRPLVDVMPAFSWDAFVHAPEPLLRTLRVLGSASPAVQREVLRRASRHVAFRLKAEAAPIADACRALAPHSVRPGFTNPLPAALAAWHRGEITLTPGRLARYRKVLIDRLRLLRLDVIRETFLARLQKGFSNIEKATNAQQHALRLLAFVESNRRPLRKFLKAHWSGDLAYLPGHPLTRDWYRKHPDLPRKVWETGIPFPAAAPYEFSIETDPLEILKMGTYVGSCLALGGGNAHSAAAVLLDANKQVLYLRDSRRRVVARQLLCISEENKLVCFHVYSPLKRPAIGELFRRYDREFAAALGLEVYRYDPDRDTEYTISRILSESWYDDGNWDLTDT